MIKVVCPCCFNGAFVDKKPCPCCDGQGWVWKPKKKNSPALKNKKARY